MKINRLIESSKFIIKLLAPTLNYLITKNNKSIFFGYLLTIYLLIENNLYDRIVTMSKEEVPNPNKFMKKKTPIYVGWLLLRSIFQTTPIYR